MTKKYEIEPIGYIKSPYKDREDAPRQGFLEPEIEGEAIIEEKWRRALKGLEEHERIVLLFCFHRSQEVRMTVDKPWLNGEKGVFATCSPNRPNHLGTTEVTLVSVDGLKIKFKGPDMIDGTPLLDIKPALRPKT